ncbi:MAG: type II secretion system F family protein [archaeon]
MPEPTLSRETEERLMDEAFLWDTFATMLSSGVPILQTLRITGESFPRYASEMNEIHDSVKEGTSIAEIVDRRRDSFHPLSAYLIDVGETTGSLPDTLMKTRDIIKSDIENNIDARTPGTCSGMEKYAFFKYTGTLVDTGLPLLKGLSIVSKIPYLGRMKQSMDAIVRDVDKDYTFSEAMHNNRGNYFTNLDVNMVKAGEVGGVLEVVLGRLSDYTLRVNSRK